MHSKGVKRMIIILSIFAVLVLAALILYFFLSNSSTSFDGILI